MNAWTFGATGGRGDAVGTIVEPSVTELVELPVKVDVSGKQTKLVDVVTASFVVVVGVGT